MALLLEPQAFSELLERVVEYNLQLAAVARQRCGVEILPLPTTWPMHGLLMRPDTYFEMVAPHFATSCRLQGPGYLCIKHCDARSTPWSISGSSAASIAWTDRSRRGYVMGEMKGKYGSTVCLKGTSTVRAPCAAGRQKTSPRK